MPAGLRIALYQRIRFLQEEIPTRETARQSTRRSRRELEALLFALEALGAPFQPPSPDYERPEQAEAPRPVEPARVSIPVETLRLMVGLYIKGASLEEIAEELGTTVGMVRAGLHEAGYAIAVEQERGRS